jgi:hypothetical protein
MRQLKGPQDFVEERDRLYYLRLHQADVVNDAQKAIWNEIQMLNRDRDKWISILTMAKCVSQELYDKLHPWAQENALYMVEAQVDDVKRCLVESLLGKSGNVTVHEISDVFMDLLDRYDLIKRDYQGQPVRWQNRTVIRLLAELGIFKSSVQPREAGTGRTQVWVNKDRVNALAVGTYGLNGLVAKDNHRRGPLEDFLSEDKQGESPEASQSSQTSQSSPENGQNTEDCEEREEREAPRTLEAMLEWFPESDAIEIPKYIWERCANLIFKLAEQGKIEEMKVGVWRRILEDEIL